MSSRSMSALYCLQNMCNIHCSPKGCIRFRNVGVKFSLHLATKPSVRSDNDAELLVKFISKVLDGAPSLQRM